MRLLFQPAEEGGAGASYMIKEGALGNAEAIFGMHISAEVPTGTMSSSAGPLLAAVSFFKAKIMGKGGHAASPHSSIDPILAASFAILALQHLVSRETDPLSSQACNYHLEFVGFMVLASNWNFVIIRINILSQKHMIIY